MYWCCSLFLWNWHWNWVQSSTFFHCWNFSYCYWPKYIHKNSPSIPLSRKKLSNLIASHIDTYRFLMFRILLAWKNSRTIYTFASSRLLLTLSLFCHFNFIEFRLNKYEISTNDVHFRLISCEPITMFRHCSCLSIICVFVFRFNSSVLFFAWWDHTNNHWATAKTSRLFVSYYFIYFFSRLALPRNPNGTNFIVYDIFIVDPLMNTFYDWIGKVDIRKTMVKKIDVKKRRSCLRWDGRLVLNR